MRRSKARSELSLHWPMRLNNKAVICWVNLLALLALGSCSSFSEQNNNSTQIPGLYLPPTPAITSIPLGEKNEAGEATSTLSAPVPTLAVNCNNSLVYLEDITIPDGSPANAGEALDKEWRVENAGTCNWDSSYRIKLIAGPALEAPNEQALYPARSGSQATIRIVFTAPAEAGRYRSAWQAYDPQGAPFGDPIFIEFIIEGATPSPTP
jgi:hypothetical protein